MKKQVRILINSIYNYKLTVYYTVPTTVDVNI